MSTKTKNSAVTTTENAVATTAPTLAQRVVKIQFHLQNMANSAIIIGQELLECKKEVGHGNWGNWLEENFKMTDRTARNFMQIAERFGNSSNSQFRKSISDLNSTQMIALLALPEGEEENFVTEKAAAGTPVENMTVKKLRAEIKKYKEAADEKDAEIERLEIKARNLNNSCTIAINEVVAFSEENEKLQAELQQLKDNPIEVIKTETVVPDDYAEAKAAVVDLQNRIFELQEQLANPKVELATDGEYDSLKQELETTKKQLADLQAVQKDFERDFEVSKNLEQLFNAVNFLYNHQHNLAKVFQQFNGNKAALEQLDEIFSVLKKSL